MANRIKCQTERCNNEDDGMFEVTVRHKGRIVIDFGKFLCSSHRKEFVKAIKESLYDTHMSNRRLSRSSKG